MPGRSGSSPGTRNQFSSSWTPGCGGGSDRMRKLAPPGGGSRGNPASLRSRPSSTLPTEPSSHDSAQFLDALAQRVAVTIDRARFERVTKVSPPTPLTASQLSLLTESCDAVIAAYGH